MAGKPSMRVLWVADKLGYGPMLHDVGRWYLSVEPALSRTDVTAVALRGDPALLSLLGRHGVSVTLLNHGRFDLRTFFALRRIIREKEIDIVHLHGYGASAFGRVAAKLAGIPVIAHQHDSTVEGPWYARLCDRVMAGWTSRVIASAVSVADFCKEERSFSPDRVITWHPAVPVEPAPVDDIKRASAKGALGLPKDAPVVGTAGRFTPEKGMRIFIEAAARVVTHIPNAHFVVMGEGPDRGGLEEVVKRLGLAERVHWLKPEADPRPALAAMDCFVSASVVDGAQMVVFSAMASGIPIAATAVSGTLDVLRHDENALLVPSRDPRSLSEAMLEVLTNPGRSGRLAAQAFADSRAFDIRDYADRLEVVYDAVRAEHSLPKAKRAASHSPWITLARYMTVGVSGATVHLGTLWTLVERLGLPVLFSTTAGFVAAVVSNFILNRLWTFRSRERNVRLQFVRFVTVSLCGLVINAALMWILVHSINVPYLASQVLTIGVVSFWNFIANTYWTFQPIRFPAAEHPLSDYPYDVTVVIPALNEEHRLPVTLRSMGPYFQSRKLRGEVIVVDDGSTDRTLEIVTHMPADGYKLRVIHHPVNRGKGSAVRAGFRAAQGAHVLMMDADNATPIDSLDALWPQRADNRILIGSRHIRGWWRSPGVPRIRYFISRAGNQMIQWLLLPGINDTQCGFKLFGYSVAKALAARQRITRFGFDMELLAIARALRVPMMEIEVPWTAIPGSRVRPVRDSWRVFGELMTIKANLMTGAYHIEQAAGLNMRESA